MRLYAQGGLEQVTMRTIGQELGVSTMMPYRHFASKDEIFVEIRSRVFDNFADYLEAATQGPPTPVLRFVNYCYAYIAFAVGAPRDYQFIFERWPKKQYELVVQREGKLALTKSRAFDVQLSVTSELLGKPASHRQVVEQAHIVWLTLHGLVSLHTAKKLGFGATVDDLIKPVIKSLLGNITDLPQPMPRRPALAPPVGLISPGKASGRGRRRTPATAAT